MSNDEARRNDRMTRLCCAHLSAFVLRHSCVIRHPSIRHFVGCAGPENLVTVLIVSQRDDRIDLGGA